MFAGFNVEIDDSAILGDCFYGVGVEIFNQQKRYLNNNLRRIVYKDNYIDGTILQEDWFPEIDVDIFISHSHNDSDFAISLSGWLYEIFGIIAFVDSSIWGYSNSLLKIIDNKYCVLSDLNNKKTYNYDKRNISTSHVHLMLATALSQMIDKAECLFFLNTPESILLSDSLATKTTASPWIYYELQQSNVIRHRRLSEYRPTIIHDSKERVFESSNSLAVKYDVRLDHLEYIDNDDILYWWQRGRTVEHSLDVLYEYKNLLPMHL